MKAIVAEINKKQMIVITDKGDFIKVKRRISAAIGDEIEIKPQKTYLTYKRLAPIAVSFLACMFLSTGAYAYYTPYSYVSVDINPSIALSLNRFERVISVNPLTEDAVSFINDTKNLKNQDIDKALSEIIKSASEKGYIDEESENQVMVVVSTENPKQEEKLASTVNITASKELSKVNKNYDVMVEKTSVESYRKALSNKISPGKEILADKLRELNPEVKDEEVMKMSVKEVVNLIKEGRKAVKPEEKDDKTKDQDKKEYAMKNNGREKNNREEAQEADSRNEKGIKENGKTRPSAAASKNNKGTNESKEKGNAAVTSKTEKDNEHTGRDKDKDDKEKDEDSREAGKKKDKNNKDKIKSKDKKDDNSERKVKDDAKNSKDKDGKDKKEGKDKGKSRHKKQGH